ncbi:MAG: T9SS type A sorting domain-containing protein, partial [bacterium]
FDGANLFGHKAFSLTYALAELQDGEGDNTRDELLARILNFFDVVSDIEENTVVDGNLVNVYPNPGNDRVTLEFNLEESASVSIRFYDMSGKLISMEDEDFSTGNHRYEISTENLPRGVYHIHVLTGIRSETLKWIKVN